MHDSSFLDVLASEQRTLDELCSHLEVGDWDRPTPAAGWSVRDQVSHLADTEEIAHDTVTGGARTLGAEIERLGGSVTQHGVEWGRNLGADPVVLEWWRGAAARNVQALRSADTTQRVPWGLGMKWRSFVTARTMEHWAHALDIAAAVGVDYPDTTRLEHVANLCYASLPYGFRVAGVEPPADRSLGVRLHGPGGEVWTFGPSDATDKIEGPAGVWCRRAVQRISPAEASEALEVEGPLARLAVEHARAFL